jgi:hypothetical protein
MAERASLTEVSEWFVMQGVPPEQVYVDEATSSTYLDLPDGWRNLPVSEVMSLATGAENTSFTNDAGEPLATQPVATNPAEAYEAAVPTGAPIAPVESGVPAESLGTLYEEGVSDGVGAPPPAPSYGYGGGGGFSASAPLPAYAEPGMPGGEFNDGGYGYQEQVYVPGGAAAGPFETRAAPMAGGGGGGGFRGSSSGGGGGGGASDAYWNLRNKLMGKVNSFGSGGSSYGSYGGYGSYGSSGGTTGWQDPYEKPDYGTNRGFSKRYEEEPLHETILNNPHAILPKFLDPGGVAYNWLRGLDTGALAELTGRMARGKTGSWAGEEKIDPKTGYIIPPKYKQGKYTNELGKFYENQVNGTGSLDRGALMHALVTAPRKSYVGGQFNPRHKTIDSVASRYNYGTGKTDYKVGHVSRGIDILDQTASAQRYLEAAISVGPSYTANAYRSAVQNDIDTWTEQALKRKNAGSLTRSLKRGGW